MLTFNFCCWLVSISCIAQFWTLPVTADNILRLPNNLPPHMNDHSEDKAKERESDAVLQRLQQQQPAVVRKMSSDPGEMFFLHYWSFEEKGCTTEHNNNISILFQPPTPLHSDHDARPLHMMKRLFRLPVSAASHYAKRDFVCPTDTNACTSIGRPNVCCPSTSTCQIVPDMGLGDVGCCDAASTCAGSPSQCPAGYTGCPNNPGGGCCLPGYACYEEGCVQTSTTVVVVTPTTSTTSSPLSPSTITDTTTIIITPTVASQASPSPITVTETKTITTGPSSTTLVPSVSSATSSCSPGFRSCPASFGGGCCSTNYACGSNTCIAPTSTANVEPPVRGTSSPSASSTGTYIGCPGGFYACSAYYPGACCQIGRDCHSTSCPAASGVTVLNSGSVAVVAPTGASVSHALPTGACAAYWTTCSADLGGGCCPSGYVCGTAACTAAITGLSGTQAKIAPNSACKMIDTNLLLLVGGIVVVALNTLMVA